MKLINIVYRIRNIIKNYRKYRHTIVYDRHFNEIINKLIKIVCEKSYYYEPIQNLFLDYYNGMNLIYHFLKIQYIIKNYDDDISMIKILKVDNKDAINAIIMDINDFVYCDMELTENQKDKMNLIIHKKYIK